MRTLKTYDAPVDSTGPCDGYDDLTLECERVEQLTFLVRDTLMRITDHADECEVENLTYALALVAENINERMGTIRTAAATLRTRPRSVPTHE